MVICFFTFFLSCQNEDIVLHDTAKAEEVSPEWVSSKDLFSILNNPEIKNSITAITSGGGLQKKGNTEYDEKYFEKIVTKDYTNYSLYISEYSQDQPYDLFFIVTVDNKNSENALYVKYFPDVKYLPKNGKLSFNIKKFTGLMKVYDLDYNIQGSAQIASGILSDGIMVVEDCITKTFFTEVPCSNGDGHLIGENCQPGYVNDAHYQISSVTDCYKTYTFIGGTSGGGAGGGGISYNQAFLNSLTGTQKSIMDKYPEVEKAIFKHIEYYANGLDFPKEMLNILAESEIEEPLGPEGLSALKMALATKTGGYFTKPFDATYHQLIDPHTEVNLNGPEIETWKIYFSIQCAGLRFQHPDWPNYKIYWYAAKEMVHIGLDLIGLVPVVGEIADLANGVIYTIHGDGVNASLSYASAIPVAGWAAVGAKFAKRSDGLIYGIKAANNSIDFGKRNSDKFRKFCGLTKGDPRQAHHIISRANEIVGHDVVQKATQSLKSKREGFHIDSALNGIAVAAWRNQPNHNAYNNRIITRLTDFKKLNPNATPDQCYDELIDIISDAKAAIINNPNVHLNNLIF